MATHSKTLLLGCGYVLERVAPLLKSQSTLAVSRQESRVGELRSKGINAIVADLSNPKSIVGIFKHNEISILIDSIPPLALNGDALDAVYAPLMNILNANKLRAIYLSTTGVYGRTNGETVSESTSPEPSTASAKRRLLVEELYASHCADSCAVRIPAIYGPGRGIGTALRAGRFRMIEDGLRWSNRIQVEDLSAIIAQLVESPTIPRTLNATDDYPALQREVVEFYCQEFGIPPPKSISLEEAKVQGMDTLLGNQRVSNHLLKSLLKYSLKYPSFREGAASEFSL